LSALPSLRHDLVLQQGKAAVHRYDRSTRWSGADMAGAAATVRFDATGVSLPVRALYAGTGLI
jgi:hypothetical protein